MRVIALPTEKAEADSAFGIFHTAAFQGEGPKDHAKARVLGKLQDALEAISNEETATVEGQTISRRVLKPSVTEIRLEDAHYEVLKERIFGAAITWLPAAARRVMAAYDLVSEAVEEKPGVTAGEVKDVVPMKRKKK
jgi:hypothetical protein